MFAWIEDTQLREMLDVRGVVDVLRKAGQPRELAIVPDEVIAALSYDAPDLGFEAGDNVTIAHGRWSGLSGLYARSEDERVILLFQLLGRQTEIPFHRSEVRKTLVRT
jgi:transcription antitermination factor NusG